MKANVLKSVFIDAVPTLFSKWLQDSDVARLTCTPKHVEAQPSASM